MKYEIKRHNDYFRIEELPKQKFYLDIINEETPCDGCVHIQTCGKQRKACYAFALYVNQGIVDWQMPRKPSKVTYARVMWLNDVSLTREINKLRREYAE